MQEGCDIDVRRRWGRTPGGVARITMRPSPRALAGLAPTLFVLVLVLVLVLHIAANATVRFLLFLACRVVD